MLLTEGQALEAVAALTKGDAKKYFSAILGHGRVPSLEDFAAQDAEQLEKCDEFVDCIQTVVDTLTDLIRNRPRQSKLVPSKDGSKLEPKGGTPPKTPSAARSSTTSRPSKPKNKTSKKKTNSKKTNSKKKGKK